MHLTCLSPYNGVKDSNNIPIIKYHFVDYEYRGRYIEAVSSNNLSYCLKLSMGSNAFKPL